jgi:hypothetical protein
MSYEGRYAGCCGLARFCVLLASRIVVLLALDRG